MRRNLSTIIAAGLSALLACALDAVEVSKPNILMIVSDDQGYADSGFMGSKEILTPNLDRLAKSGVILKAHYVQPVCSPTRSSLMTGRNVGHTGVYRVVRPHAAWGLPLDERTLAQALKENGYETAIVGKWHLGEFQESYLPTQRGFDQQYGQWYGAIDYFTHKRDNVLDWHRNDKQCDDEGYSTTLLAKEACRIVREKKDDKPLFLYLPFNAVHAPLQVPDSYRAPFANLKGNRQTYAAMTAAMDEAVGQVVAALEEKKLRDNTLIIFTSDNGGPSPGKVTDNSPLRAGKGTIYEGGVRSCAFVNWPGHLPEGKESNEPIHAVDWYPTLLKLAGIPLDQKKPLDGCDIWPVLANGTKSPHQNLVLWGMNPRQAALRSGDWKLLIRPSDKDAEDSDDDKTAGERVELYNLAEDIGETRNRAADMPDKAKELRERLLAIMKDAVAPGDSQAEKKLKRKQK